MRVEQALDSNVVKSPGRKTGTNIFLGDENGPAVRRLARVQACRPEISNRKALSREVERAGRRLGIRKRREVILMALVLPDGTVGEVKADRSSGNHQMDRMPTTVLRSAEFSPPVIEGIRVQVWIRFPVVFAPTSSPNLARVDD